MTRAEQAVLKTLVYADVFDYPLTKTEIKKWLIWEHPSTPPSIDSALKAFPKTNHYYHLKSRQSILSIRRQRQRFSQLKWQLARRASRCLKLIPFIKLIAVTGALTMNNSDQNDDIDLIIVTSPNRLWLTRIFSVLLLELLHLRRRPQDRHTANKICLNLFLDEFSLKLPPSQRHLYTAHEICQIKPLFDKGNTYQKFLNANPWVKNYLPNALKIPQLKPSSFKQTNSPLLETLAYKFQLYYMRKKRTREHIAPHSAFFHPRPTSQIILKKYHQKLKFLI